MEGFARLAHFLHCTGMVDGTHITFKPPRRAHGAAKIINCKHFFAMLHQGATDHTNCFIDVELGFSGHNHDSFVFKRSALCVAMDTGLFVPGNPTTIARVSVLPLVLLAELACPIWGWLMKPYGGHIDEQRMHFDKCLSRARNVVECTLGRLKQHWRCLSSWLCASERDVAVVTSAFVALHICKQEGCTSVLYQAIRPTVVLPNNVDITVGKDISTPWLRLLGMPYQPSFIMETSHDNDSDIFLC